MKRMGIVPCSKAKCLINRKSIFNTICIFRFSITVTYYIGFLLPQIFTLCHIVIPVSVVVICHTIRLCHIIVWVHIIICEKASLHLKVCCPLESEFKSYIPCFLIDSVPACRFSFPQFRQFCPGFVIVWPCISNKSINLKGIVICPGAKPLKVYPRICLILLG